jgi:IS6 family transposase
VSRQWRHVHRAIDQFGQVIDVYVSIKRDREAARRFFQHALDSTKGIPLEVTTDRAPVHPRFLDELAPQAWHCTEQYRNNRIEADHGQLKRRLRPMRALGSRPRRHGRDRGHALVQNIRRGHYALAVDEPANRRIAAAFDELATAI